jgi:4-diphosphocytidyl-2-C-methyl-D-erythritol kinase
VLAAAKLNLLLEVRARRTDGYHEIETLMVPIGLYDSVWIETDRTAPYGDLHLSCRWAPGLTKSAPVVKLRSGAEDVGAADGDPAHDRHRPLSADWEDLPLGSENIVVRALELLRARAGVSAGALIRLTKRIPSAAGLGGGSSDAAAALAAANRVWKLGMSERQLESIGAEIGSDVPFFLASGAAKCTGRGEQVEPVRGIPTIDFVVVVPPGGLSTADVYRQCQPASSPSVPPRSEQLCEALQRKDFKVAAKAMHNQLEPAAERLSPWIGRAKRDLAGSGCAAVQMSGSGASCFGVCPSALHARHAARLLRSRGWSRSWAVRSTRFAQMERFNTPTV